MTTRKLPILTVVAAALVNEAGHILLSRRPSGKMMAGMWEFPGGKIEPQESPEDALARELLEEIGITVQTCHMQPATFASHAYDSFHLLMPLYLIRQWQDDPTPREGQCLAWVKLQDIDIATMPPPDGPLIERIREMLRR